MELATLEDLEMMEERIMSEIRRLLSVPQPENTTKSWVKKKAALEMMSCSPNKLVDFAIHGMIKRNKNMGNWYYSTKSINDFLENHKN